MSDMPVEEGAATLWRLLDDGRTVRLQLPAIPIAEHAEPLKIHLDFDAASIDEIIECLIVLRSQMLPAPKRQ